LSASFKTDAGCAKTKNLFENDVKFSFAVFVALVCMDFSTCFGIGHRNSCSPSKSPLPGRVDTSRQLRQLRARLKAMALDAFIITRDDEHQVRHFFFFNFNFNTVPSGFCFIIGICDEFIII
jgi:hypothetical protein